MALIKSKIFIKFQFLINRGFSSTNPPLQHILRVQSDIIMPHRKAKYNLTTFFLGLMLLFTYKGVTAMEISSSAFNDGDLIPAIYTCDGKNISPPLTWKDAPATTKSFALICDDPDASKGTWTHWVLYNIPTATSTLEENVQRLPSGTQVGFNSWPQDKYNGPCPPSGTHRYFFKLYALDVMLDLSGKVTTEILQKNIKGHILANAVLMGKYSRKK